MTDGAHKNETRARMKDPFMMNGERYCTQRIKDHKKVTAAPCPS